METKWEDNGSSKGVPAPIAGESSASKIRLLVALIGSPVCALVCLVLLLSGLLPRLMIVSVVITGICGFMLLLTRRVESGTSAAAAKLLTGISLLICLLTLILWLPFTFLRSVKDSSRQHQTVTMLKALRDTIIARSKSRFPKELQPQKLVYGNWKLIEKNKFLHNGYIYRYFPSPNGKGFIILAWRQKGNKQQKCLFISEKGPVYENLVTNTENVNDYNKALQLLRKAQSTNH